MLTLAELMTPAPVTIAPDATLREAVERLAMLGFSALPVTEGDAILGILSTQAIVAFEAATPGVPTERDVTELFDDEEPPDDDLPPSEYFAELWDDAGLDVVERLRVTDTPEWDFLSEHTVDEAMIADPPQLPSSATIATAAELMRATGSHGVLVVDAGRLNGIVTTMDITRRFTENRQRKFSETSDKRGTVC